MKVNKPYDFHTIVVFKKKKTKEKKQVECFKNETMLFDVVTAFIFLS